MGVKENGRRKWEQGRKVERERDEVKVEGKAERVWMCEEWGGRAEIKGMKKSSKEELFG